MEIGSHGAMITSYCPSPVWLFEIWRAVWLSVAVSSGFLRRKLLCSSTLRALHSLQAEGIRGRGQRWATLRGRGGCPVCVWALHAEPTAGPWLSHGCEACRPFAYSISVFPILSGTNDGCVMPDGSHHHHWTAEICLNIVSTIGLFILSPWFSLAVIRRQHLRDLLRRSRVENCQNRLLYGFSED